MARPIRIQNVDPIIDAVQETYAEMLRRHHNFNDWETEDYELLEEQLNQASTAVQQLRATAVPQSEDQPTEPPQIDLEAIRKRVAAATRGDWGYNSYSAIFANSLIAGYDDSPDYPDGPRPGGTPGHAFFDDADNAWLAQRHAAYEADPIVAHVPAEYGDTATGRHAADAEFISHAKRDVPALLGMADRLRAELDDIKGRGYGSLFADELTRSGHRPWMHGTFGPFCWCHKNWTSTER